MALATAPVRKGPTPEDLQRKAREEAIKRQQEEQARQREVDGAQRGGTTSALGARVFGSRPVEGDMGVKTLRVGVVTARQETKASGQEMPVSREAEAERIKASAIESAIMQGAERELRADLKSGWAGKTPEERRAMVRAKAEDSNFKAKYEEAVSKVFRPEITGAVDGIVGNLPGSAESKAKLQEHIYVHALQQQVDNPEWYVSHGFDHSVNVKKKVDDIIKTNEGILGVMHDKYGLNDKEARAMLGLVAIYHDFGYPEAQVGDRGKAVHAVTGAQIAGSPEFRDIMAGALGRKPEEVRELMHDFKDAILFHSADKVETTYDAKIKATHGEFLVGARARGGKALTEAERAQEIVHVYSEFKKQTGEETMTILCSEETEKQVKLAMEAQGLKHEGIVFERPQEGVTGFKGREVDLERKKDKLMGVEFHRVDANESPMAFTIRVADNLDMQETRFSELQRNPAFKEMYRALCPDLGNQVSEGNPQAQRLADLRNAKQDEAASRLQEEIVDGVLDKHNIVPDQNEGHELSVYKSFLRARLKALGMHSDDQSMRHFGGCESVKGVTLQGSRLTIEVDREKFETLNQTVVRDKSTDVMGVVRNVDVGVGEYQIFRSMEAYRSLSVGGEGIQIDVVYANAEGTQQQMPLDAIRSDALRMHVATTRGVTLEGISAAN